MRKVIILFVLLLVILAGVWLWGGDSSTVTIEMTDEQIEAQNIAKEMIEYANEEARQRAEEGARQMQEQYGN